jgi:endogenous inhibitor of DNA gyrase (YacG/DUF329 family)
VSITVNCPICRRPTVYGPENEWRPFCSQRCKLIDLGAWASDAYRIDNTPADDEDEGAGGSERPEEGR